MTTSETVIDDPPPLPSDSTSNSDRNGFATIREVSPLTEVPARVSWVPGTLTTTIGTASRQGAQTPDLQIGGARGHADDMPSFPRVFPPVDPAVLKASRKQDHRTDKRVTTTLLPMADVVLDRLQRTTEGIEEKDGNTYLSDAGLNESRSMAFSPSPSEPPSMTILPPPSALTGAFHAQFTPTASATASPMLDADTRSLPISTNEVQERLDKEKIILHVPPERANAVVQELLLHVSPFPSDDMGKEEERAKADGKKEEEVDMDRMPSSSDENMDVYATNATTSETRGALQLTHSVLDKEQNVEKKNKEGEEQEDRNEDDAAETCDDEKLQDPEESVFASPSRSIKRFWADLELEESQRSDEQRRLRVDHTPSVYQQQEAHHHQHLLAQRQTMPPFQHAPQQLVGLQQHPKHEGVDLLPRSYSASPPASPKANFLSRSMPASPALSPSHRSSALAPAPLAALHSPRLHDHHVGQPSLRPPVHQPMQVQSNDVAMPVPSPLASLLTAPFMTPASSPSASSVTTTATTTTTTTTTTATTTTMTGNAEGGVIHPFGSSDASPIAIVPSSTSSSTSSPSASSSSSCLAPSSLSAASASDKASSSTGSVASSATLDTNTSMVNAATKHYEPFLSMLAVPDHLQEDLKMRDDDISEDKEDEEGRNVSAGRREDALFTVNAKRHARFQNYNAPSFDAYWQQQEEMEDELNGIDAMQENRSIYLNHQSASSAAVSMSDIAMGGIDSMDETDEGTTEEEEEEEEEMRRAIFHHDDLADDASFSSTSSTSELRRHDENEEIELEEYQGRDDAFPSSERASSIMTMPTTTAAEERADRQEAWRRINRQDPRPTDLEYAFVMEMTHMQCERRRAQLAGGPPFDPVTGPGSSSFDAARHRQMANRNMQGLRIETAPPPPFVSSTSPHRFISPPDTPDHDLKVGPALRPKIAERREAAKSRAEEDEEEDDDEEEAGAGRDDGANEEEESEEEILLDISRPVLPMRSPAVADGTAPAFHWPSASHYTLYTPPATPESVAFGSPADAPLFPDDKPFDLVVAASFAPKRPRSEAYLPSLCRYDAGEDAFFACRNAQQGWTIGIADGVGGWSELGVDPSLFAWSLMRHLERHATAVEEPMPLSLLDKSYQATIASGDVKAGSSTAFVGIFDRENASFRTTNLGDSGFLILRPQTSSMGPGASGGKTYQKVFRSVDTQHYFNAPYQLSIVPVYMQHSGARSLGDRPSDSTHTVHDLCHGDVLIFATDGLWDNLFEDEICALVSDKMAAASLPSSSGPSPVSSAGSSSPSPSQDWRSPAKTVDRIDQAALQETLRDLSQDMTSKAKIASRQQFRPSPFSKSAREADRYHLGG